MKANIPKLIGQIVNMVGYISPNSAARLSIFLFSRPRKGKLKSVANSILDGSDTKKLKYELDDIMTYRWQGSNQRILLAHGWESNSTRWDNLIDHLRKLNHDVIALDAPAHGMSGGKSFNAILYAKYIEVTIKEFQPDVIIGHSVGGMASVFSKYMIQESSLTKMVLLGAPDKFTDVLQRYVDMMGYNSRVHNQINQYVLSRYGKKPDYFSTASFSEKLPVHTLIIHDEKDAIIPFQDAEMIKAAATNSQLIKTKGLGHGLKADYVYQHISEFINS